MAEELAKIDTEVKVTEPKTPAGGRLSFSDIMGVREPFVKKKGELREQARMAEEQILTSQQAQKETAAEGKMAVEQRTTQQVRGAQKQLQERIKAEPLPAFVPTQDNFRDVAGLFSLIGVMGMIAGKSNGLAAMNAMNGMLEGYRSGRNDLYRREREVFDKNFKTMLQKHSEFRKEMEDAVKLAQTDRQAGLQAAELAAVKAGSPIIKAQIARGRLLDAYEEVKDFEGAAFKAVQMFDANLNAERAAAERAAQAARAEAQRNRQLVQTAQGLRVADISQIPQATAEELVSATPFRGGGQGKQGQNNLQFSQRIFNNIVGASVDLKNLVGLPAISQSPVLSGIINTDPSTAVGSMVALVSRSITPEEERAFDQVSNSLSQALSRLEGQGLASASTKANIQAFDALKPRAGDQAINMALYIARVKQEIETGINVHEEHPGATPGQIRKTKKILEDLDRIVPYETQDVLMVLGQGRGTLDQKMQNLLKVQPITQSYEKDVYGQRGGQAPTQQVAPTQQAAQNRPQGVPASARYSPSTNAWWWEENGEWKSQGAQ
jgi:hypothetical protein